MRAQKFYDGSKNFQKKKLFLENFENFFKN